MVDEVLERDCRGGVREVEAYAEDGVVGCG